MHGLLQDVIRSSAKLSWFNGFDLISSCSSQVFNVSPWFLPVPQVILHVDLFSSCSSLVDHVSPCCPPVVPVDPVLKQRGPQWFVKYLAKYEVVFYADDREEIFYCCGGNLLVRDKLY